MKVLVVTPTTGAPELVDALTSVKGQVIPADWEVKHLVVVDGPEFLDATIERLEAAEVRESVLLQTLPYNTGGGGFYGHKIYASVSQMLMPDVDYVCFLDEDNWFESSHIQSVVSYAVEGGLDFSYSLRSFFSRDGKFFADDNCASLGKWKIWDNGGHHLIDTGAYCFKREFIERWGYLWNMGWGADIRFIESVMGFAKYDCTRLRTLCYRLGAPEAEKYEEELKFIVDNNAFSAAKYGENYPWAVS